ncbi:PPM family protein phosphatase [Gammaproteobacteria bacterium]
MSRVQRIHGRFEVAAMTDRGNVRASNEDGFLVDPYIGLIIVADGMAGQGNREGSGIEATDLAIKSIYNYLSQDKTAPPPPSPPLTSDETILCGNDAHKSHGIMERDRRTISPLERTKEAVAYANTQIYLLNRACGRPDRMGIGATLVGLYWPSSAEGRAIVFHVGKNRIYRLRDNVLHHLTHDHSAAQKWVDNGMRGLAPANNSLLRAVGPTANVNADISTYMLLPGDVILLCTDGLNTMVTDRDIKIVLHQVATRMITVEQGTMEMIEMAKRNGGKDNITVALGIL